MRLSWVWLWVAGIAFLYGGCVHSPQHCQSGAKGTQCYTQMSPGDPPAHEAEEDDEESAPDSRPPATTPR